MLLFSVVFDLFWFIVILGSYVTGRPCPGVLNPGHGPFPGVESSGKVGSMSREILLKLSLFVSWSDKFEMAGRDCYVHVCIDFRNVKKEV